MKNKFDDINNALDIECESVEIEPQKVEIEPQKKEESSITQSSSNHENDDYLYTRANLYSLIEKAQQAVNEVMEVAQQSDSPRAYEVVFQGIKHASDVTEKLIDLQQKMQKLTGEEKSTPNTVNNTMFVGSTADLQKILKKGIFDSK